MVKVYQIKNGILLEFPPLSFKDSAFYDNVITRKNDCENPPLIIYSLWGNKEKVLSECCGDYKVKVQIAIINPSITLYKYVNPERILKQSLEENTEYRILPYMLYEERLDKVITNKEFSIQELQRIIERSGDCFYVGKEILKQFILILKQQYE